MAESTEDRAAWVARASYGRLLAILATRSRDIAAAEDALSDAFERALTTWPDKGIPDNPEAWLLTVARNRERDRFRSAAHQRRAPLNERLHVATVDAIDPDAIPDERLALMFVCAHPAIDRSIRTPLMLQVVLGFKVEQIATAFAMPTSTMNQRLVRAKRRVRDAGIPFVVPDRADMPARLTEVLEAIYGAYAIDWQPVAGTTARLGLATEALHLSETAAQLLPDGPEAHGLAALVCLSLARAPARVDASGVLVPVQDQDTDVWDAALIDRGEGHLRHAHRLGCIGRFQLEAAVQSVHCARRITGTTDWSALRTFYERLLAIAPTLGGAVALAVVIGETDGPEAGLIHLDSLADDRLNRMQPAWAARAHLQAGVGDTPAARASLRKAISLTTDTATRLYLERKLADLERPPRARP